MPIDRRHLQYASGGKNHLIKLNSHLGFESGKAKLSKSPSDPGRVFHVKRNVSIRQNAKELGCVPAKTQSKGSSISSSAVILDIEPEVMAALIRKKRIKCI